VDLPAVRNVVPVPERRRLAGADLVLDAPLLTEASLDGIMTDRPSLLERVVRS
jgi:hypothetical protein